MLMASTIRTDRALRAVQDTVSAMRVALVLHEDYRSAMDIYTNGLLDEVDELGRALTVGVNEHIERDRSNRERLAK